MLNYLLFAEPALERRFRKLCDSQHEVGGYLFSTLMPVRGLNRRTIKKLLRTPWHANIAIITSWVVLPNEAKHKEREWGTTLNKPAMESLARLTSRSLDMPFDYHFHTHPGYNVTPSTMDVQFWLKHCQFWDHKTDTGAEAVIIAGANFDMRLFRVTLDKKSNKYSLENTCAYSWSDWRLREYRHEVFGR